MQYKYISIIDRVIVIQKLDPSSIGYPDNWTISILNIDNLSICFILGNRKRTSLTEKHIRFI